MATYIMHSMLMVNVSGVGIYQSQVYFRDESHFELQVLKVRFQMDLSNIDKQFQFMRGSVLNIPSILPKLERSK